MAKKAWITESPTVLELERKIDEAEQYYRDAKDRLTMLKNHLAEALRSEERQHGGIARTKRWRLNRASEIRVSTVQIRLLRRYVTNEIIDRCTSIRLRKNTPLQRVKQP